MRFPLAIIASILIAYALGYHLAVPANPEVKFWQEVIERRNHEIADVREQRPDVPIIFFTGGSSTAFSIDPKVIEESCELPAFNLGLPIAAGAEYLVFQALEKTKRGDYLVICLEPDILSTVNPDSSPSKFSFAMSCRIDSPSDAGGGPHLGRPMSFRDYLNLSRPGAGYLATFTARAITGKPYRYTTSDIRYRGRIETQLKIAQPVGVPEIRTLSSYGSELLRRISLESQRCGVTLLYSLPWAYVTDDSLESSRGVNESLLSQIQPIVPILNDRFVGSSSESAWFSDSPQHLTAAGSEARSRALAEQLRTRLNPHH